MTELNELIPAAFPILCSITIFFVFLNSTKKMVGSNLLAEIGIFYCIIILSYTLSPALEIMAGQFATEDTSGLLVFRNEELVDFLWLLVLYSGGFAVGYLVSRGRTSIPSRIFIAHAVRIKYVLYPLLFLFILSIVCNMVLSAPVETYYDNYTRYDHLSSELKKITSVFTRVRLGASSVLLPILFLICENKKKYLFVFIAAICAFEIVFTHGSRIQVLILLLQSLLLYHILLHPLHIRQIIFTISTIVIASSIVELLRLASVEGVSLSDALTAYHFKLPGELGSVYAPAVFLYSQRELGQLPMADPFMFFYEFLSLFLPGDDVSFNPMEWFRYNYFPQTPVAPWTLGPVAESAIWGGVIDLFLRSILNGLFFGILARWFAKNKNNWYVLVIYCFCFASSILTIKYSVFYLLNPILKNVSPILLFCWLLIVIFKIDLKLSSR